MTSHANTSRPTWCDALLTVALLGLSLWAFLPLSRRVAGDPLAQVFQDGRLVRQVALDADRRIDIAGGRLTLEVKAGRVRIVHADCPNQVCLRTGWIAQPSQTLVCAPNRVVILIAGGRKAKAPEYDAVTR